VVLFSPKSPEGLEADEEIIRLESMLRNKQVQKEQAVQIKETEEQRLERMKVNLNRELDGKYKEQVDKLQLQINQLEEEKQRLARQAADAKEETDKIRKEMEELKELNGHHRRKYLYYRRQYLNLKGR